MSVNEKILTGIVASLAVACVIWVGGQLIKVSVFEQEIENLRDSVTALIQIHMEQNE